MNFDLTQFNTNFGGSMGTPTNVDVDWYDGQPSINGIDITTVADSTDLTVMPDIWALLTDTITGCPEEINLIYEFEECP